MLRWLRFPMAITLPGGGPSKPVATHGQSWDPGDSAGVREPRRPHPTGGAGVAHHPVDPGPPGMD